MADVTGECSATVTGAPTATDNCAGTITGTTTDPLTYNTQGTFTITWTFDDGNGNTSTQTQTVVVDDVTAPVPDAATLADVTGECSATVTGAPTATDNCAGTITGTTTDPLTYNTQGTFTITWTFDDGNGNTSTQTQTVIVDDITPPTIVCPGPQTVDANAMCSGTIANYTGLPTVNDNCSSPANISVSQNIPVGTMITATTPITLTATDEAGNSANCTFNVSVVDVTPPSITCPANQTVMIDANCQATISDYSSMATVSDNCSMAANISVVQNPTPGTIITADTDITLTAADEADNVNSCTFKVILDDMEDPVITCPISVTALSAGANCQAALPDYASEVTATDNCPGLNVVQMPAIGTLIGSTTTVTYTATDAAGNSASCSFEVNIVDDTPPVLVQCLADTFLIASANCSAMLPDFIPLIQFEDNCTDYNDLKITQVPPSGTQITSNTVVGVVALDSVGLISDTCFFLVELRDTTPPTITCPASINTNTGANNCGATIPFPMPTTNDNCGIDTVICNPVSGTFFTAGTTTVTCTVMDVGGNTNTCDFTITVNDGIPPFLGCRSDTVIVVPVGTVDTMIFNLSLDSLSDNCGVDTLYHSLMGATTGNGDGDVSGTAFMVGTTTVTYYAEDETGNIDSCSFDVLVVETITIDLDCPANYAVPTDDGQCTAVVNTDAPGVDPVAGLDTIYYVLTNATTGSGPDSVPDTQIFNIGETTVTYTAVSITNDTSSCSFTLTVTDQQAPSITCPPSITTVDNTPDSCGVIFNASVQLASATDNCPGVQVTYSVATGAMVPVGTTTITATATDGANLTASCSYQLRVRDTQKPVILSCPPNRMVNNDMGLCGARVTWTPPTATDNCDVVLLSSTPYEIGDTIPVGNNNIITYTAVDAAGNFTECKFNVAVMDNEPPTLNPCPGNISVDNDPGLCSAVVTWPFISPDDNCNVVSFIVLPQSGSTFPVGSTPVQAVATDQAGNVTVCSFTVKVNDVQFPTMTNVPNNITVDNDPGECGAVVTWPAIVVNDNCGIDTFFCTAQSGDFFLVGMNDVDCTVTDVNGNSLEMDFTITVRDVEPPVVSCPANITIFVDGSVEVDPSDFVSSYQAVSCDSVRVNYNAITATDNCAVASISQPIGPVSGSILATGSHLLTYVIKDVNANEKFCSFTINVEGVPPATSDAFPNNPCEGQDVLFFTDDYPGAVYVWKDPMGNTISNDPSFTKTGMTVDMSGTYTVTITFPFDCVLTDEVDVTVFPKPVLAITKNDLLCVAANTPLTLEAIDSANSGITNYQWSTPGGAVFFGNPVTVNNPVQGTYSLVATTANGCTATASTFVEISAVPQKPDLTGSTTELCVGQSVTLDGEEFAGPNIDYHWSASPSLVAAGIIDQDNHDNIGKPIAPGTYTYYFYVTQGGCISDSAEWNVTVEAFPAFTLDVVGQTACVDGSSDIVISAIGASAGLDWTIDVNGNCAATQVDSMFTLSNVNANCSGLYEVTATSSIGCATTTSVNLNITNKPVTPILQVTDDTICMGGSTTLFLTNTPFGANILCFQNGVQVSCATMLGSPIQPASTTQYGVQYDVNGCVSDTIFRMVTVEPPLDIPITVTGDVTCVDGTGTVTLSTPATGTSYTWDGPCGVQVGNVLEIPNITAACSGVYSVSVTGTLGQCINIGNLQLEVTGMLDPITAVQNGPACSGGDISLCAEPDMPGAKYTWRDPFGNIFSNERCPETVAIAATTPYTVTVEVDGCTATDDTLVTVLTRPDAKAETVVGIVDTPQSFDVVANDILSSPNYSISVVQQPNSGSVSYNGEGVFTYTPKAGFRETDIMAYEICLDECPDLCDVAIVTILVRYPIDQCIATTVITPNDDSINDEFVVSCLELGGCPNNQLFIFNQWGDQVFEAAPYDNTWKGTFNGKDVPDGTYFYIFQCDRDTPAEKGFVMIHR